MKRLLLIGALALLAPAPAGAQESAPETEEALPAGTGREETFYACTACHNTAIIRRSRLPRAQWDGLMDWMTEKHGMAPLEGEQRQVIVDYLARHFGPSMANPRARNPFLN
ncbi:MAG TPA: hypothetical protein VGM87_21220 [Roseomonas sp.]|jgi:hypothetical protein